jgi:hypothetical protein
MRTYSFDHFKAEKPEPSMANPGGARQVPSGEEAKPPVPSSAEELHYGRQHAQTAELYRKHREERERAGQLHASGVQEEPLGGEAPPLEGQGRRAEPVIHGKEDVEEHHHHPHPHHEHAHHAPKPDETGREVLKDMAQQAVSSVLEAAKEAAKGRPLVGARKLAGDAFSGVRRVAREVSARTGRSSPEKQKSGKKGAGKKR